jgi:hypothetical protein
MPCFHQILESTSWRAFSISLSLLRPLIFSGPTKLWFVCFVSYIGSSTTCVFENPVFQSDPYWIPNVAKFLWLWHKHGMLGIYKHLQCNKLTRKSFMLLTNCKILLKYAYFKKLFGYFFLGPTLVHRSNKQVIIVSLIHLQPKQILGWALSHCQASALDGAQCQSCCTVSTYCKPRMIGTTRTMYYCDL